MEKQGNGADIALSGIQRAGSDATCEAGTCNEVIGMEFRDGMYRPYAPTNSGISYEEGDVNAWVHKTSQQDNYLFLKDSGYLYWISEEDLKAGNNTRKLLCKIGNSNHIDFVGNVLKPQNSGNVYYLFKEGTYKELDLSKIDFDMQLDVMRTGLVFNSSFSGHYYNVMKTNIPTVYSRLFDNVRKAGFFCGIAYMRYGIELYDGNIIGASVPILVCDTDLDVAFNNDESPLHTWYDQNNKTLDNRQKSNKLYYALSRVFGTEVWTYTSDYYLKKDDTVVNKTGQGDGAEDKSNTIDSSTSIDKYDLSSGEYQNKIKEQPYDYWRVLSKSSFSALFNNEILSTSGFNLKSVFFRLIANDAEQYNRKVYYCGCQCMASLPIYRIVSAIPDGLDDFVRSVNIYMTNPVSYYKTDIDTVFDNETLLRETSNVEYIMHPESFGIETIEKELKESLNVFYKIYEIPYDELKEMKVGDYSFCNNKENKLATITNQPILESSSNNEQTYCISKIYNGRLHIASISQGENKYAISDSMNTGNLYGTVRYLENIFAKTNYENYSGLYDFNNPTNRFYGGEIFDFSFMNYRKFKLSLNTEGTIDFTEKDLGSENRKIYASNINRMPRIDGISTNSSIPKSLLSQLNNVYGELDFGMSCIQMTSGGAYRFFFENIIDYVFLFIVTLKDENGELYSYYTTSRSECIADENGKDISYIRIPLNKKSFVYPNENCEKVDVYVVCNVIGRSDTKPIGKTESTTAYFTSYSKLKNYYILNENNDTVTSVYIDLTTGLDMCSIDGDTDYILKQTSTTKPGSGDFKYRPLKSISDYLSDKGYNFRDNEIRNGNILKVSAVNNPIYFPDAQTYTVGDGRILGFASNAIALSQDQFGQYPLYIFCTDGIYAMEVDTSGSVAYSRCAPVSREVCCNADTICEIDGGVVFGSERGLMLISGSNPKLISEQINGEPDVLLPSINIYHTSHSGTESTSHVGSMGILYSKKSGEHAVFPGRSYRIHYTNNGINAVKILVGIKTSDHSYLTDLYPTEYCSSGASADFCFTLPETWEEKEVGVVSLFAYSGSLDAIGDYSLTVDIYNEPDKCKGLTVYGKAIDRAQLVQLTGAISTDDFRDYLKAEGTNVSYLYVRDELIVYNQSYNYAYIISIGTWHCVKQYLSVAFNTHDYPDTQFALCDDFDFRRFPIRSSHRSTDTLIQTRPIHLSNAAFGRTLRVVVRGVFHQRSDSNRKAGMYVLGSNDCKGWQLMGGKEIDATGTYVRNIGATLLHTSCRYIMVVFVGSLLPDSEINGIQISTDEKYNNKLK